MLYYIINLNVVTYRPHDYRLICVHAAYSTLKSVYYIYINISIHSRLSQLSRARRGEEVTSVALSQTRHAGAETESGPKIGCRAGIFIWGIDTRGTGYTTYQERDKGSQRMRDPAGDRPLGVVRKTRVGVQRKPENKL